MILNMGKGLLDWVMGKYFKAILIMIRFKDMGFFIELIRV